MFGNRGAIHVHPRLVAAQRLIVNEARNHFFPRAGLTDYEYGGRMARELFRQLHHAAQGFAADDNIALDEPGFSGCGQRLLHPGIPLRFPGLWRSVKKCVPMM